MSITYPHRKKSRVIISGERRGHGIGPSRPIKCPGKMHVKKFSDNGFNQRRIPLSKDELFIEFYNDDEF
jgi:hypothetical protein